jgi:hypothetical protein
MATPLSTSETFTCVTCEIEITGRPTFHVGLAFCCAGCVADGPCICSYDHEEEQGQVRECLDVESVLGARRPDDRSLGDLPWASARKELIRSR